MSISQTLTNTGTAPVLAGSITRFVRSQRSYWGQITANGDDRKIFFNRASLSHTSDFDLLELGQQVRFEVESDPVNKSHAVRVFPIHADPYTDFSRSSGR